MLEEHLVYVSDVNRLKQYQSAIDIILKPGDHVIDLGAGSGVLGLMCLKGGAGEATAIDSTVMLNVARKTMQKAGFSDQCLFLSGSSLHVEAKPADLVICDQVGYFGFDAGIVVFLRDARERFLKTGGKLIPARITMYLAAIESANDYRHAEGWGKDVVPDEFHWLREYGINAKYPVRIGVESIISSDHALGEIDFYRDSQDFYSWNAEIVITRDATLHGLLGWFDCTLAPGINITNSPLAEDAINRPQAFFPINEPVAVKKGQKLLARIMTRPGDDLIIWELEVCTTKQKFSHYNAEGLLALSDAEAAKNPTHKPLRKISHTVRNVILGYCDGTRTKQEIIDLILDKHTDLMPTKETLTAFVKHIIARDTH